MEDIINVGYAIVNTLGMGLLPGASLQFDTDEMCIYLYTALGKTYRLSLEEIL